MRTSQKVLTVSALGAADVVMGSGAVGTRAFVDAGTGSV